MNKSEDYTPRSRKPWALLAAGLLLTLAAGVALGEWSGWPFLAGPLQRYASAALQRTVRLDAVTGAQAFSVRFIGGLRLVAPRLEVAAPSWSAAPHLLLAQDLLLELQYTDLWRAYSGQALHIQRLQASHLDADVERLADGRASWSFRPVATDPPVTAPVTAQPLQLPSFEHLRLDNGVLRCRDAPLAIDLEARLTASHAAAAAAASGNQAGMAAAEGAVDVRAQASGHYRKLPLRVTLRAAPGAAAAVPFILSASVGRAALTFQGTADSAALALAGHFSLQGPSLAAVGDPVGVTLPTTAAFRTEGRIVKQGSVWRVRVDEATIGASRLNGAFTYDAGDGGRRARPLLAGRLGGTRLALVDLGPVVGTTPVDARSTPGFAPGSAPGPAPGSTPNTAPVARVVLAQGKVLPARPFDLQALRAMDANVLIDIAEVDLHTAVLQPLRPLRGHLQLVAGLLTLRDLDARTAQGRLAGDLSLDGRGDLALWKAQLRWSEVRLEQWLQLTRKPGVPPYVSGALQGTANLQGQGRSTAEILASLHGQSRTELRGGTVSHLGIEIAGLDLAESLGMLIKGDDALKVDCAVADLVASGGVFKPRVMVLDTSDSSVWVDGSLSLASESLDLRAVVRPKDFSPLTLRSPLWVRGSFAHPEVSLDKTALGRKLAAALLLALVNPVAALIPLVDTGEAAVAMPAMARCNGHGTGTPAAAPAVPASAAAAAAATTRNAAQARHSRVR